MAANFAATSDQSRADAPTSPTTRKDHIYMNSTVSVEEKELFYNLMYPLQFYVAQKLRIPFDVQITAVQDFKDKLPLQAKMLVRDSMYENLHLLDEFTNENPFNMTAAELEIILHWKRHYVSGTFIVERHLQKGSIFILNGEQAQPRSTPPVYLVHGLETPIVQMIPKYMLPQCVTCVLLPFKDKIIYDGLMKALPMSFGHNMTNAFREIYMRAKQQDLIQHTLIPERAVVVNTTQQHDNNSEVQATKKKRRKEDSKEDEVSVTDVKKLCQEIVKSVALLKTSCSKGMEKSACTVLLAAAQMAQKVIDNPGDTTQLEKGLKSLKTCLNRL